jgi:hypothetical protein
VEFRLVAPGPRLLDEAEAYDSDGSYLAMLRQ